MAPIPLLRHGDGHKPNWKVHFSICLHTVNSTEPFYPLIFYRRLFPSLAVSVSGLDPLATYLMFMDIVPVNSNRYKHYSKWIAVGKVEEPEPRSRYFHSESPRMGKQWMKHQISFQHAKVTNNRKTTSNHVRER